MSVTATRRLGGMLSAFLLCASSVLAAGPVPVEIHGVCADVDGDTLTLYGANFDTGDPPSVTLGELVLGRTPLSC